MTKFDYKAFNLRYEKFKKNNLPTPFWDKERQVLEYVFYDKDHYNINSNLTDAQIEASDVNHSKTVTAADYGKLKNVVLGKSTIEQ